MVELIIFHPINDIILEPEKEEYHYKRTITRRVYDREDSLEMLDKFKKFAKINSLDILDPFKNLGDTEIKFLDFILKERIRKDLKYKFLIDLGDNFYHIVLPDCPTNFIYKNMILFKSNLEMLETDMIRYINRQKKDKIFNHFILKSRITINCKIEKNIDLIKDFIDLFSISKNDIERIVFDIVGKLSQPIEDVQLFKGNIDIFVSIDGNPSNLEFLLFVKEYFSRF